MNFLFKRPIPEVFLDAIFGVKFLHISWPEFKQSILSPFLVNLFMYQFNVEGDIGRHHLSISGAYTECGISTSTINRSAGKTFPPKIKLSEGRVGFRLDQIEEWLNGKRGGWN